LLKLQTAAQIRRQILHHGRFGHDTEGVGGGSDSAEAELAW
jgi:hypothetical protein